MQNVRAVLMDIDGTLLDSAEAQTQCWLRVLQDFGYPVQYRQVRARIGMGPDRILRELCGISEASPRAQRLLPIRELLLRSRDLPEIHCFPRVHEFIARVRGSGSQVAIVSSACRSEALALLGAAQLLTEFDHVVCKEDVARTKPAPDGVQVALQRMGVAPEHAVLIASSPYDLAAAHAAGVSCVALRSGGWADSALTGDSSAYRDLSALLSDWQDLPLSGRAQKLSAPPPHLWREPSLTRRSTTRPSTPHAL